jgi:D-glycero-D-manno-heptose 1,7-bisphosphate phosphatase
LADLAAPLVLLDRDGVINRDSDEYIKSPAEWQPLPGSLAALARLSAAGFRIGVVTNQSGIGRGLFTEATLAAIHAVMRDTVAAAGGRIDGIFYCPHRPDAGCPCRKPEPGLLLEAATAFGVNPAGVAFIGDKPSDARAAIAAGARPILVGAAAAADSGLTAIERYPDLAAAAAVLIAEHEAR